MSAVHIPQERIASRIYFIRGKKVMFDHDLAKLYEVPTKSLNLAVKRNRARFPEDFMFQLTKHEAAYSLRFQFETSNVGRGGRRYLPFVFTQEGVAMLSSVLRSLRAIQVNIAIVRTFVRLREILSTQKDLVDKLDKLEQKVGKHDREIQAIFDAIRRMMTVPERPKGRMGFYKE